MWVLMLKWERSGRSVREWISNKCLGRTASSFNSPRIYFAWSTDGRSHCLLIIDSGIIFMFLSTPLNYEGICQFKIWAKRSGGLGNEWPLLLFQPRSFGPPRSETQRDSRVLREPKPPPSLTRSPLNTNPAESPNRTARREIAPKVRATSESLKDAQYAHFVAAPGIGPLPLACLQSPPACPACLPACLPAFLPSFCSVAGWCTTC